jgi:hypothetical protein
MFRRLIVTFMVGGRAVFEDTSGIGSFEETDTFEISFNSFSYESDSSTLRDFQRMVSNAGIDWLYAQSGRWTFDPSAFKLELPGFILPAWLVRKVPVAVEVVQYDDRFAGQVRRRSRVVVRMEQAEIQSKGPVFLSHKSAAKPLVRDIATALALASVDTWFDENSLNAGSHLERSLSEAFKDASAAVFIVTPSYEDRGYLATEVDYAIREKRARGDFQIITIRIGAPEAEIPELLKSYVWKDVSDGLGALIEILRALRKA